MHPYFAPLARLFAACGGGGAYHALLDGARLPERGWRRLATSLRLEPELIATLAVG